MKAINKFAAPLAVAVGIAAFAIPATAADMIMEQAPIPAPVDIVPSESTGWAGPYLGVQGGYNWGKVRAPGNRVDNEGAHGSAFAGWQGQAGSIVYGIEGDVGYNGSKGNNGGLRTKSGIDGSVRARLGYAVNDTIMVYGTGGAAAQELRVRDAAGGDKDSMIGYTVGAGVDAKLTQQVFGRLEYRYSDFGKKTFDTGSGPQRVGSQDNKVMLGLGVKF